MSVMRLVGVFIIQCVAMLIVPSAAIATKFSLNQDTPSGSYSWWRGEDLKSTGSLSANVTVNKLREDDKWAPWVGFQLRSSSAPEDAIDIKFVFSVKTQAAAAAEITATEKGKKVDTLEIPGNFAVNQPFDVTIVWSIDGVNIKIGGVPEHKVPMPFVPAQMRIWSGTADVTIANVELQ